MSLPARLVLLLALAATLAAVTIVYGELARGEEACSRWQASSVSVDEFGNVSGPYTSEGCGL